jgi:predicted Zn-dependent protease
MEFVEKILFEKGITKVKNLYDISNTTIVHHLDKCLTAHKLYKKDVDYLVKDDQVYIMDEFTYNGQKNVCIHELGHALGLEHNTSSDIMYMYATQRVKLSHNDKISYDFAYKYVY